MLKNYFSSVHKIQLSDSSKMLLKSGLYCTTSMMVLAFANIKKVRFKLEQKGLCHYHHLLGGGGYRTGGLFCRSTKTKTMKWDAHTMLKRKEGSKAYFFALHTLHPSSMIEFHVLMRRQSSSSSISQAEKMEAAGNCCWVEDEQPLIEAHSYNPVCLDFIVYYAELGWYLQMWARPGLTEFLYYY